MSQPPNIDEVRRRIDEIDDQVQVLLRERAQCAQSIAALKQAKGDTNFYRPEREAQVLRRIASQHKGPLSPEAELRVFREIMSACLALERQLSVAFLGPAGTFSQEAALKHFGHGIAMAPQVAIADVFREVDTGRCDYGVVPAENSTEGSVTPTLDMFLNSTLKICGEVELRVRLHLLNRSGNAGHVKRICGHQQALAQCRDWLETHYRGIEVVAVSSNGEAARIASADESVAAVAGDAAADEYKLQKLATGIEDQANNTTRFIVIGRHSTPPSGKDKTSLLVMTGNQPGALHRMLSPFAQHNISLTRIQSRPSRRGTWDYVFFIDIEGHAEDKKLASALQELAQQAATVRVLGAYPCAVY